MATFNEFQRELQKRNITTENSYMFTLVYERLAHVAKAQEDLAKAMMVLAQSMQGLVVLREQDQAVLHRLSRGLSEDGVDVRSVANEPEKH